MMWVGQEKTLATDVWKGKVSNSEKYEKRYRCKKEITKHEFISLLDLWKCGKILERRNIAIFFFVIWSDQILHVVGLCNIITVTVLYPCLSLLLILLII